VHAQKRGEGAIKVGTPKNPQNGLFWPFLTFFEDPPFLVKKGPFLAFFDLFQKPPFLTKKWSFLGI